MKNVQTVCMKNKKIPSFKSFHQLLPSERKMINFPFFLNNNKNVCVKGEKEKIE